MNSIKVAVISVVVLIVGLGLWYFVADSQGGNTTGIFEQLSPDRTSNEALPPQNVTPAERGTVAPDVSDAENQVEAHTYKFVGTVLIDADPSTSQVEQEDVPTNTGLFDGHRGRITLNDSACKLQADNTYSFTVTYTESDKKYKCVSARFISSKGSHGF